jgi:hypothetical protein
VDLGVDSPDLRQLGKETLEMTHFKNVQSLGEGMKIVSFFVT